MGCGGGKAAPGSSTPTHYCSDGLGGTSCDKILLEKSVKIIRYVTLILTYSQCLHWAYTLKMLVS